MKFFVGFAHFLVFLVFFNSGCRETVPKEIKFQNSSCASIDSITRLSDSTEWANFSHLCWEQKNPGKFIETYSYHLQKGTKAMRPYDMVWLREQELNLNCLNHPKSIFTLYNSIARLNTSLHLNNDTAESYLNKALSWAKKIKDSCSIVSAYRSLSAFEIDVKHDLVKGHQYLTYIDTIENKLLDQNRCDDKATTHVAFSVLYFYLEDYDKSIDYLNKGILSERGHRNDPQILFDLYKRRSYFEYELGKFDQAHKTIDSALRIAESAANSKILVQKGNARKAVILCKEKKYEKVGELIRSINLNNLQSSEYYIYLEELANYHLYNNDISLAKEVAIQIKYDLKPWNDQWWMTAHLVSYKIAKAERKTVEALAAFEAYKQRYDNVHGERRRNTLMANEIKYRTQQKEELIKLSAAELKVQQAVYKSSVITFIAIILFLLVAVGLYAFKKLKEKQKMQHEFSKKLICITDFERSRIAKDLHDDLSHQLLLVKNNLATKMEIENAEKIGESIDTLRRISRDLYPASLDKVGLKLAIEAIIEQVDSQESFFVSTEINYLDSTLNKSSELQVFRIIQEAMNNIIKYAQASAIKIEITVRSKDVKFVIKDNGKGFDIREKLASSESFGLYSMLNRAESMKAKLLFTSKINRGSKIELIVPLVKAR